MALNEKLRDRIRAFSAELRREVYGPQGYPAWGTKFIDIENQTGVHKGNCAESQHPGKRQ
jgi:hypothetical protein